MGGFRVFTLANVPVSISPWYLFLLYYLSRGNASPLVAAVCITLSLLVHEFGHALMARRFGMNPEITLLGFGGVTSHEPAQRDRDDALIVAAGPGAGLLLAGVSYATLAFVPNVPPTLAPLLEYLVLINVFWSIYNLLPMWPMDGGQLFRLGMLKLFKPVTAERITHGTGLVLAGLAVMVAMRMGYGPMMFFILALTGWQNLQALMAGSSGQIVRRENPRAAELLALAERAYADGEDEAAARFCHQLRAESNLPPNVLARAWAILGVTATRKGEYEEALSYLKRAPDQTEVVEALAQCFYQLDMLEELKALTRTKSFEKLPSDTRAQIMGALAT